MFQVTYSYTRPMVRDAMRYFLWRYSARRIIPIAIALVLSLWTATHVELRWFSGAFAGLVLAWGRSFVFDYRAAIHNAEVFISVPLTLRLTDTGVEVDCEITRSFIPWAAVQVVVCTSNYLFLTCSGSSRPFVVPVASIESEATSFLFARVREAGGRVRP
jgi:hypothetical protein